MVNQSQFIEKTKRWRTRSTIGGLVDVNITKAGKKFEAESTIQYIDISSVDNATNTVLGATEYIFKDAPSRAQQCIKAEDILVSTVRPNLKNNAVNHLSGDNLVASSGFCVLRPKDGYTGLLLAYILSDEFTEKMTLVAKGTNYPAVHDLDILDYEITVPEKDEVKRIDSLYRQADKSKFAGFKSQFIERYGNSPKQCIGDIAKECSKGQPFKKDNIIESGSTPCIHYGELFTKYGPYIDDVCSTTNDAAMKVSQVGDILFPASDVTPNGLTRCSAIMRSGVLLGGDIIILRLREGLSPEYTSYAICMQKQQLLECITGSVIKHLSAKSILNVKVPIPANRKDQDAFVAIMRQADKSKYLN